MTADQVIGWGKRIVSASRSAHRVILDAYLPRSVLSVALADPEPELVSKLRTIQFWGDTQTDKRMTPPQYGKWLVPREHVLTPWPYRGNNTFVGIVSATSAKDGLNPARPPAGYIVGKNPAQFLQKASTKVEQSTNKLDQMWCTPAANASASGTCEQNPRNIGSFPDLEPIKKQVSLIKPTVQALLDAGITMYSSCPSAAACDLPEGVQFLGKMTGAQYQDFLQSNVSFALGVGYPLLSPSPLDAMASGVAFLNPKFPESFSAYGVLDVEPDVGNVTTQHDELARIVPEPYLYNVDFQAPESVIAAARKSSRNRFASYVPSLLSIESTTARVLRDVLL